MIIIYNKCTSSFPANESAEKLLFKALCSTMVLLFTYLLASVLKLPLADDGNTVKLLALLSPFKIKHKIYSIYI